MPPYLIKAPCLFSRSLGYPRDAPATVLFGEWFRFGKPSDQYPHNVALTTYFRLSKIAKLQRSLQITNINNIHKQIKDESIHPMVVMKLVVKDPSENRKRRQLFPTPARKEKTGYYPQQLRLTVVANQEELYESCSRKKRGWMKARNVPVCAGGGIGGRRWDRRLAATEDEIGASSTRRLKSMEPAGKEGCKVGETPIRHCVSKHCVFRKQTGSVRHRYGLETRKTPIRHQSN
ncbi:hypothetical protein LXL04_005185 [Taraxacum kok-saghyz]